MDKRSTRAKTEKVRDQRLKMMALPLVDDDHPP
jgi:hypothetical protein